MRNKHHGVLPQLNNPLMRPRERTLFYQVMVGSNFLTPSSHKKKPQCLFCDKKATFSHLLFECSHCKGLSDLPCIIEITQSKLFNSKLTGAKHFLDKISDLYQARNYRSLFLFYMGLHESDATQRRYRKTLRVTQKIAASCLARTKAAWTAQLAVNNS